MPLTPTIQASVAPIIMVDGTGGLDETLEAVDQQVYEAYAPVIVGPGGHSSVDEAAASFPQATQFFWILREGAVPAPDALAALISDSARAEAGIAGSKVVDDDNTLVAVGLVTDVFGNGYTGLDDDERDQGQYDVVRDVAAVAGVSMVVRRDLLFGLGGTDSEMAPHAASIDLCQRARLKGGRVIISPASVVTYSGGDASSLRWREEASRIRLVMKAYSPLTLLWVIPLEVLIGIVEFIVSLFFGRWLVGDFVRAWGWVIGHTPSTLSARGRARRGRVVGDSELFRFQRRGSVKISRLSQRAMEGMRSRLPGDESLSMESLGRDLRQPAFVIGVLAVIFVLLGSRNLWSDGLPAVGYTLPFPVNGWDVLDAYAGGWNPAGLGSAELLRPLLAISGAAKIVTFHSATLAEYLLASGALLVGIWGMTRLLRTWSIAAAPALIAGIAYVAGPTAQGIAGNTHLGTLLGMSLLPWAIRIALAPLREGIRPALGRLAGAILIFGLMGAFSPLLLLVPVPIVGVYAIFRFTDGTAWRGFVIALAGTAGGALLLSPWIWSTSFRAMIKDGYAYWEISPVLAGAGAVVALTAVVAARRPLGVVAGWGALMAAAGFFVARAGSFGVGTEAESVGLVLSGLGVAVSIAIVASTLTVPDLGRWRRFAAGVGVVGVILFMVAASTIILGGRIGLPGDQIQSMLSFTEANEGEAERSRVLLVGPEDLMPGDSRTIDGGAYRVVSAPYPDLGEARLANRGPLDEKLRDTMDLIVSGDTQRAGGELAEYGIKWIVVLGDSSGSDADEASLAWREVFAGQLDLLPLSAGVTNAVFVSDTPNVGRALSSTAESWARIGWTYSGTAESGKTVQVAENPHASFGPGPWRVISSANQVAADEGVVTFEADGSARAQAYGVVAVLVVLAIVGIWGRRRS